MHHIITLSSICCNFDTHGASLYKDIQRMEAWSKWLSFGKYSFQVFQEIMSNWIEKVHCN